jgi:uncharacterized membrane protein
MLFVVLRFVHIIAGIIWAGGAIMMNLIIGPTIAATGDSGKQFAGYLIGKTGFTKMMTAAALTTVLAGIVLYGLDSNWFQSGWMFSNQGIIFGIGGVSGILAMITGIMNGRLIAAVGALGAQIQGKPTDEQASAMAALRKRHSFVVPANTIFTFLAIACMAGARFSNF